MEPRKVIPALQADGHEVIAVQYGLDSFEEDVATVKRTLNRVGSPVILVGHSYGGATITAAGVDERVVGLVYIAAVAPDASETVQNQLDKYPSDIFTVLRRRPLPGRPEARVGHSLCACLRSVPPTEA
jgi:pimeloyl-ACP methyl ester carboxylesterase